MIFMLWSGTYLFQVGLISVLAREFRYTICATLCYTLLTIIYAAVKFNYFQKVPDRNDGLWVYSGYSFVSALQKLGSLGFYLALIEACGRLGEAEWYWRGPWVARYVQPRTDDLERGRR